MFDEAANHNDQPRAGETGNQRWGWHVRQLCKRRALLRQDDGRAGSDRSSGCRQRREASLKAVGIILSIALLVAPGAIAFLVARTFVGMLSVAVGSVILSALTGIFVSYHIDSEPAPTMVLMMTGLFIVALVVSQVRDMRMRRVARG